MKLHPDNAAQVIALYQREIAVRDEAAKAWTKLMESQEQEIEQLKAERDELLEIIDGCHICTAAREHAAGKGTEP